MEEPEKKELSERNRGGRDVQGRAGGTAREHAPERLSDAGRL